MKEQLIARWDAFLKKMNDRFEESLRQGEEAVLDSLDENAYDYYSSFRTLMAIRSQLYDTLVQKVSSTWQQQVEPAMRADGNYWPDESRKGYRLEETMHERLELWRYITEGKLSQKYYDYAIQLINRNFFCTQCHSPLEIQKDFFMAQYVTCRYCHAVNTFEPETKYVTIGWNVVDNIAALYALDEYKAMEKARAQGGGAWKQAVSAYYEKYFDKRIQLMPHTAATRAKDMESAIYKHTHNNYGNN